MRLSLNRPVRLFVDSNTDVAGNLRQEFVRIKAKKEGDREAIVTGVHSAVEGHTHGAASSGFQYCVVNSMEPSNTLLYHQGNENLAFIEGWP